MALRKSAPYKASRERVLEVATGNSEVAADIERSLAAPASNPAVSQQLADKASKIKFKEASYSGVLDDVTLTEVKLIIADSDDTPNIVATPVDLIVSVTGGLPESSTIAWSTEVDMENASTAPYWTFDTPTGGYYVWYTVTPEGAFSDPGPVGSRTGIQVTIPDSLAYTVSGYTANAIEASSAAVTVEVASEFDSPAFMMTIANSDVGGVTDIGAGTMNDESTLATNIAVISQGSYAALIDESGDGVLAVAASDWVESTSNGRVSLEATLNVKSNGPSGSPEISTINWASMWAPEVGVGAPYWTFDTPEGSYYVWYTVADGSAYSDPGPIGSRTGIQISTDTSAYGPQGIATIEAAANVTLAIGGEFDSPGFEGTLTNGTAGSVTDIGVGTMNADGGSFAVAVTQQGTSGVALKITNPDPSTFPSGKAVDVTDTVPILFE